MAWAAIVASVHMGFLRAFIQGVEHTVPRFFYYCCLGTGWQPIVLTMNYNEQLNALFEVWKKESEKYNEQREATDEANIIFTEDGILEKGDKYAIDVEAAWHNSAKRILFILKDQPTEWCNDARLWLKEERNQNLQNRFIRNIANIFWGLYSSDKNNLCTYDSLIHQREQVQQCFNINPFALIESKKQGGGTSISNTTLIKYLKRYGDLLSKEIDILNPNMIVCTSPIIYDFVCKRYGQDNLERIDPVEHNSIRIHRPSKTLIFCSYHPSARKSEQCIYEGVMDHYRAFLLSE